MDTKRQKEESEKQISDLSEDLEVFVPNAVKDEMKEISLQNIVATFLERFQEVANHPDYHGEAYTYADTPYIFFGVLNTILCDYYVGEQKEIELTKEIICWVNEQYNDPTVGDEVRNMFAIEFFEKSDESDQYRSLLLKQFTNRAKEELQNHIAVRREGR